MSLSNGLDAANIVNSRHTFGKSYVKQAKKMRIVAFSSTKKRSEHHCWLLFINMPYSALGSAVAIVTRPYSWWLPGPLESLWQYLQ